MFKVDDQQLDALLDKNDAALSEALTDTAFGKHGFYAPMPRDVRLLLARAAVAEARRYDMNTAKSVAGFAQAMVDMTPRFPVIPPFDALLADPSLSADEKVDKLQSIEMALAWDGALADLEENEDWHLDYWDERVDWDNADLRR